ncbi:MAG: histidinol-phosphatase [Cellulosilyticaceae bacterium]
MKNYHTHTYRCKHAVGTVNEYVESAVKQGIKVLGISEHTPFPDNRWLEVRLHMDELEDYCKEIEVAQKIFTDIRVLKGLECEYVECFKSFYKEELLEKNNMDYLILAGHVLGPNGEAPWNLGGELRSNQEELKHYAEYLVKGMATGLFTFVAHPDVFGCFYSEWDEEAKACSRYIFSAAQDLKVPLEINGYGLRKPKIETAEGIRHMYPWDKFWELGAQYDIGVLANSDAHRPEDVGASIGEALEIAKRYGLRVVELDL